MFVIIHDMGTFEDSYYHLADSIELANKIGAEICMDLQNDLDEEHDWLEEQMKGCFNSKQYSDVIELWNDYANQYESRARMEKEQPDALQFPYVYAQRNRLYCMDKVYIKEGHYHKE